MTRSELQRHGRLATELLAATAELVWPLRCAGCGAQGSAWCIDCRVCSGVPAADPFPVRASSDETRVPHTREDDTDHGSAVPAPVQVWAATEFTGAAARAVRAYKDHDRRDLVEPLGQALAVSVRASVAVHLLRATPPGGTDGDAGPGGWRCVGRAGRADDVLQVLLVPVPSRPVAVRRRGDTPLHGLTRVAAAEISGRPAFEGGPTLRASWATVLELRRRVTDQRGLRRGARVLNLHGAMRVRPRWLGPLRTWPVIVAVDDVHTTGATLDEAVRALREAAGPPVCAAVVAATPL